jgi:hypothetical protein
MDTNQDKQQKEDKMKQCDIDLINFMKKHNNQWQWYGNDYGTKKMVRRLVRRNICISKSELLNNGYTYRQVKLVINA